MSSNNYKNEQINDFQSFIRSQKEMLVFARQEMTEVSDLESAKTNVKKKGRPRKNRKNILLTLPEVVFQDLEKLSQLKSMEVNDFIRDCIRKGLYE